LAFYTAFLYCPCEREQNRAKERFALAENTYSNLIRYKSSGVYFARFRVHGKLIWKSLKTDQVTVAKLRLADLEKAERQSAESQTGAANGKMTFSAALDIYKARLDGDVSLKPKSKVYYRERLNALNKSWPALGKMDVRFGGDKVKS
jgi:hypothetical protein